MQLVENNLQADGTKFIIHVHRNVDILIYRVRKNEHATLSEVVENNLHPDGTKFNIHVHRNGDTLKYRVRKDKHATRSEVIKITYRLMEPNSISMYIEMRTC